jgi:hypothetical protein
MTRAPSVYLTVTYGALVVAAWGLTSLVLDEDVMQYSDAGPLLGPAMAVAATLAVGGWMPQARRGGGVMLPAVGAAASAWFALVLVGAAGLTLTRGTLGTMVLFAGNYAASPFVLVPTGLAAVLVAGVAAFSRRAKPFARPYSED